jgi:Tfp pilus assembly protein PilF
MTGTRGQEPGDPVCEREAALDTALAALRDADPARAERLCNAVQAADPDNAMALYLLGHVAQQRGDEATAAARFRDALARAPAFAEAHTDLGNLYWAQDRPADAAACYRAALAARPDFAEAHNNLGVALMDTGRLGDAIASFRTAIALRPEHAQAHYNLSGLLEKMNDLDGLRTAVDAARAACPDSPYVALRAAQLAKREGALDRARRILHAIEPPPGDLTIEGEQQALLADVCDRLGETGTAFAHALEHNRCQRLTPAAKRADPGKFRARVARLTKQFTAEWVRRWSPLATPGDGRAPVFLIGFPRSGTTLLDTILRSHPDVAVVEEQPGVTAMLRTLAAMPGGHPAALAALNEADRETLRSAYWAEMRRHLPAERAPRLVVDKLPLNMVEAGAIHRVYPDARFLFVQRHPCDCVLSAFMHAFRLNDAMANFLRLRDAATLYDAAMGLWTQYRELLPLNVTTVVYEDLTTERDNGRVRGPHDQFRGDAHARSGCARAGVDRRPLRPPRNGPPARQDQHAQLQRGHTAHPHARPGPLDALSRSDGAGAAHAPALGRAHGLWRG